MNFCPKFGVGKSLSLCFSNVDGMYACIGSVLCIIGQLDWPIPLKFYLLISGLFVFFI